MPATSPRLADATATQLGAIGQCIRARRKSLRVSATTAAEAAGLSRVTLHRIERGEPSVTIGAYLNAMAALGLTMDIAPQPPSARAPDAQPGAPALPARIRLADYPQLRQLAWHIPGATELTAEEALGLYERHGRHIDRAALAPREKELLDALARGPGKGHLLV